MDKRICALYYIILLLGLCRTSSIMADECRLDSLIIDIRLQHDGTALISETRHVEVNNDFTEWYIVQDHLDDMEICDFSVTDETGTNYQFEQDWNIDRSREEKAGRCGIIRKGGDEYELCWGVGSSGYHIYTARYTMKNVVKSFDEADGFNQMFVARDLSPAPLAVRLVIASADSLFTPTNTRLWAFGYVGSIELKEGKIVAETTEPFGKESSIIVMARFEKGVFAPTGLRKGTFEQVKERALEDSDYLNGKSSFTKEDKQVAAILITIFMGIPFLMLLIGGVIVHLRRKAMLGSAMDRGASFQLPENCSLFRANALVKHLTLLSGIDSSQLMNAYMVHMLVRGIFSIAEEEKEGKQVACLKVHPWNDAGVHEEDREAEQLLYKLVYESSDDENIFRPDTLRHRDHKRESERLKDLLERKTHFTTADNPTARQLFCLKKYLRRHTTISRLPLQEMNIWKETLVYATLFGCSKKVISELERLCPHRETFFHSDTDSSDVGRATHLLLWQQFMTLTQPISNSASDSSQASFSGGAGATGGGSGGGGR